MDNSYFEKQGQANTEKTLELAFQKAEKHNIREIVIATTSGATVFKALALASDRKIIAVSYHAGFKKEFETPMPQKTIGLLEKKGVKVVISSHALSGLERSLAARYSGQYPVLLIADTLRLFGQGTKVAVEAAIMAADAGCLCGADIISIGGTVKGADTALLLRPANQNSLFNMKIREIICKPRDF